MTKSKTTIDPVSLSGQSEQQAVWTVATTKSLAVMMEAVHDGREPLLEALATNDALTAEIVRALFRRRGSALAKRQTIRNHIKNRELDMARLVMDTEDFEIVALYIQVMATEAKATGSLLDEAESICRDMMPYTHEILFNILMTHGLLLEAHGMSLTFRAKALFMFMATTPGAIFWLARAPYLAERLDDPGA